MPDWTSHVRPRLAALRLAPPREAEIVEELALHLDARFDELRAEGCSEADATRLAIAELLEPDALATRLRPLRQANASPAIAPGAPRRRLAADLWQDVRYAWRMLLRHRGFSAAAVLTLALGIGANSAMFALVDAVLLQPLPFPHPDRLVMLWEKTAQTPHGLVSPLNMLDWQRRAGSLSRVGAFVPNVGGMVMAGKDGLAETVPRQWVTAGVFEALGVQPVAGRTFQASDDGGGADVVVLAESFWRARFGGDPAIVGSQLRLDGMPFTVVGVVPDAARVIGRASLWAMVAIRNAPAQARGAHPLQAIGRLAPGVSQASAAADLDAVAAALAREFPDTNAGRGVTLEPLHEAVTGADLRRTSVLFLGVVAFVLLICCGNVASLLLVRATSRHRELAVRTALGADRARVVRQILTESVLLALAGGAAGLLVSAGILALAPAIIPEDLFPATVALTVDMRVVGFCAAMALLVGLVFGTAPAFQATRLTSAPVLGSGTRSVTSRSPLRTVLVAGEVAVAVVLLVGAGLLLRTLLAVQHVDRGYGARDILTMIVDPLGSQYPTEESLLQFFREVEREVRATPGVQDMGWASTLPLGASYRGDYAFQVLGQPPADASEQPVADYQIVSPTYFRTVDLPLLEGRSFTDQDSASAPPVCIVNEAFAKRFLAGGLPLGQRVSLRPADSAQAAPVIREVVGVARQVKSRPDEREEMLQVYVPLQQELPDDIFLVVRPAEGRAAALAGGVRRAIGRVDAAQLVSLRSVMTLDDVVAEAAAPHRFRAVLVIAFALLALVLAMVGLFGTLAYSVQQRVRDFGVRRALGASTADVLRLILASGARVVVVGAAVGVAAAMVMTRLLNSMLVDVRPLDPATFLTVLALLGATAVLAMAWPAWRAARVDPATALRLD